MWKVYVYLFFLFSTFFVDSFASNTQRDMGMSRDHLNMGGQNGGMNHDHQYMGGRDRYHKIITGLKNVFV
jgi:hypothetical protein